jgi:hypothetical protein
MTRATRLPALLLLLGATAAFAAIVWCEGSHARGGAKTAVSSAPTAKPVAASVVVSNPATPAPQSVAAAPAAPSTVAGAAGMRIYKDPETDEIGPPTAGTAILDGDGTSQDMTGLTKVTLPDGSVMVDLQGRFQEAMVMQIDAHGNRVVTCTQDVKKTLSHPPVSPAQREER